MGDDWKARKGAVGPNLGITYPRICLEWLRRTMENNPDSPRLRWDSNRAPPGYESRTLPLRQPVSPSTYEAVQQSLKCLMTAQEFRLISCKRLRNVLQAKNVMPLRVYGVILFKTHKVPFLVPVNQKFLLYHITKGMWHTQAERRRMTKENRWTLGLEAMLHER